MSYRFQAGFKKILDGTINKVIKFQAGESFIFADGVF